MEKKEFAAAVLDPEHETFVVHVMSLSFTPHVASFDFTPLDTDVHPFCRPQISGLIAKETLIKVPAEYSGFAEIFSPDLPFELSKYTEIND